MSRLVPMRIPCASCHHEFEAQVYSSINVSLNPELKEKLLNHELFRFTCPNCGHDNFYTYSLLYQDTQQKCMIQLCSEVDVPLYQRNFDMLHQIREETSDPYKYRIVTDNNAIFEKINIFDAGLDDRIIELYKASFLAESNDNKIQSLLFFVENGEYCLQSIEKDAFGPIYLISSEIYDALKEFYEDNKQYDSEKYLIDLKWAFDFLDQVK